MSSNQSNVIWTFNKNVQTFFGTPFYDLTITADSPWVEAIKKKTEAIQLAFPTLNVKRKESFQTWKPKFDIKQESEQPFFCKMPGTVIAYVSNILYRVYRSK